VGALNRAHGTFRHGRNEAANRQGHAGSRRLRARRQAAREAKLKERKDFLSELNLDLLDDGQRKTHALFLEALQVQESVGKEIADLRAVGREVPPGLQSRLADAQSVLRADCEAERRALREAAARAAGLDEKTVRQLTDDLLSIDGLFDLSQ